MIAPFADLGPLACCRLDRFPPGYLEASFGVWQRMLALLILSRREREHWYTISTDKSRSEWLIRRCAAKDAVRTLIKKVTGVSLFPADIGISLDEHGHHTVEGGWTARLHIKPVVSFAYSQGVAVAVAGIDEWHLVGVDVENLTEPRADLDQWAFTDSERALLAGLEDSHVWARRLRCAKKTAGKALGCDLARWAHSLEVDSADSHSGMVGVAVRNSLAQEYPQLANRRLPVHTVHKEDFLFSIVVCSSGKNA